MDVSQTNVYNFPPQPPVLDAVGIFYLSFGSIWTVIVIAGMVFCLYNRHIPLLRVRALTLSFTAIILLHCYWILAQLVYPIGASLPVLAAFDLQYFVMGIMFPLGIALFHAANLRFLRVAELQRQFVQPGLSKRNRRGQCPIYARVWLSRVRDLEYMTKVFVLIGLGIVVQTVLCVGMWLICRKYHPSFGVKGTELRGATVQEQLVELGRGFEWWPSILWQAIWMWIVAPVLIWRAWNIRDTLGWRTQTIGACLSGLHAVPMFLIASYVPGFAPVNRYFAPSQWIHLSTFFIEIFTIFVPIYHVLRARLTTHHASSSATGWDSESTHSEKTARSGTARLTSIKTHESRFTTATTTTTTLSLFHFTKHPSPPPSNPYDQILTPHHHHLTMPALEQFLDHHPMLLQTFSACHDFSGENISFLIRVADWKTRLPFPTSHAHDAHSPQHRELLFTAALDIYCDLISPRDADFPLNLTHDQLARLEAVFERSARLQRGALPPGGGIDLVRPFAAWAAGAEKSELSLRCARSTLVETAGGLTGWVGRVPGGFDGTVFDEAQRAVKRLVLENTWPRFVREVRGRRRGSGSGSGSLESAD